MLPLTTITAALRPALFGAAQICVVALLVLYLYAHLPEFSEMNWIANGKAVGVGAAASFICLFLNALRWRLLTSHLSIAVSLPDHLKIMLLTQALGTILPFSMSADALRVGFISRKSASITKAIATVFVDRLIPAVITIALFAFMLSLIRWPHVSGLVAFVTALLVIAACPLLSAFLRHLSLLLPRYLAHRTITMSYAFRLPAKKLAAFIGCTLLMHLIMVEAVIAIVICITQQSIPIVAGSVTVSAYLLSSIFPFSIGGWGIREIAAAEILSAFHIEAQFATTASVCLSVGMAFASLPGILLLRRCDVVSALNAIKHFGRGSSDGNG